MLSSLAAQDKPWAIWSQAPHQKALLPYLHLASLLLNFAPAALLESVLSGFLV